MKWLRPIIFFILVGVIMVHGTPDFGQSKVETIFSQVDDLGELAARLHSPDVYDRRGNVIWMDDFTHGYGAWLRSGSGTGHSELLTTSYPFRSPFAMRLTAGTDGSKLSYMANYASPQTLGTIGLESRIAFFTRWNAIWVEIHRYDGTYRYIARMRIDDTDKELTYLDVDGNDVKVDDIADLQQSYGLYHTVKLVADFSTNEYVRFMLNQEEYDLPGIALRQEDNTQVPQFMVRWYFYGRGSTNDYCQVDDVIITQNEP